MSPKDLYRKACALIPGGVNSPVRSFQAVGVDTPLFISKAQGALLTDTEGKTYIDYLGSWGPMLFGHAYEPIQKAVRLAVEQGASFGLPTAQEVELAQLICSLVPSVEMVRLTVSGTEAAMSALRLARAYTKRSKIIKFAGCYHGHSDSLLSGGAGSGFLTQNIPDANGIPAETALNTLTLEYGDLASIEKTLSTQEIAALIIEPVPANMGLVLPPADFLPRLRELCTRFKTILIFDEVISGFRLSKGGAQERYQVMPDLTVLGKIIGGGFPVGAFGGKRSIMQMIAPSGTVYHAGTLSGNLISTSAGIAALRAIQEQAPLLYPSLEQKTSFLAESARSSIKAYGLDCFVVQEASLFTVFFSKGPVKNLQEAKKCDTQKFALYFREMLKQGVLIPMAQFEAHFVSAAHSEAILQKTAEAMDKAFYQVKHG